MGKYVIKAAKNGLKFDLKAANGEVVASSQTYVSLASCKNGIAGIRKNAPVAAIEDQTVSGYAHVHNPKFEIFTNRRGEFMFQLKAGNGQIICVSEGYKAKKSCLNGIASVRKNSDSPIENTVR